MIYLIEIFNEGILNFNKIEIERWKFLMLKIEINSLILMYLKIKKRNFVKKNSKLQRGVVAVVV